MDFPKHPHQHIHWPHPEDHDSHCLNDLTILSPHYHDTFLKPHQ